MPQPVVAEIRPTDGIVRSVCLLTVRCGIAVVDHLRSDNVIRWALVRIDGIRLGGIGLGGVVVALVLLHDAADDHPGR